VKNIQMRAVIQQASKTSVQFEDEQISQKGQGLPVFRCII
jgi:D-Tyr-tRNAtyr deacylase